MSGVDETIRIDHTEVSGNRVAGSETWVYWCVVGQQEVGIVVWNRTPPYSRPLDNPLRSDQN
jgi:hypothetical protein